MFSTFEECSNFINALKTKRAKAFANYFEKNLNFLFEYKNHSRRFAVFPENIRFDQIRPRFNI
jgi:hypothetical protein